MKRYRTVKSYTKADGPTLADAINKAARDGWEVHTVDLQHREALMSRVENPNRSAPGNSHHDRALDAAHAGQWDAAIAWGLLDALVLLNTLVYSTEQTSEQDPTAP